MKLYHSPSTHSLTLRPPALAVAPVHLAGPEQHAVGVCTLWHSPLAPLDGHLRQHQQSKAAHVYSSGAA